MPKFSKTIMAIILLLGTSFVVFDFSDPFPPEKLSNSPANEAVLFNEQGTPRLFYVNRPGDADKIMSMRWTGEAWTEARKEFALPGQAYYALQMVENNKKDLITVFHVFDTGSRLSVYTGRKQLAVFNSRDISSLGLNYLRIRSANGFSKNSGVVPLVYKGY